MAISQATYSGTQWRVGIAQQSAWGTAITTQTLFYELPVSEITLPDFSGVLSDDKRRSNGKRIADATDTFRTSAGGEYTCEASFTLTKNLLGKLLYGALQQIASDGVNSPYQKLFTVDGTPVEAITPAKFFTLNFYSPASGECVAMKNVVIKTYTETCDIGSNGGRAAVKVTFLSGSTPTFGATVTPSDWVAPSSTYYLLQTLQTKTLSAGGVANEVVLSKYEYTIENGAARVGSDTSGDAEGMVFPMLEIKGSLDVKYDANTEDHIDRWFLSPTGGSADSDILLQHYTDGSVSEYELGFHTILTAPPMPAGGDKGVFQTIAWKAVTEGSTAAATFKVSDEINEGWSAS